MRAFALCAVFFGFVSTDFVLIRWGNDVLNEVQTELYLDVSFWIKGWPESNKTEM